MASPIPAFDRVRSEPLVRQPHPRARDRRPADARRRARHPRRHVEPDDLREGDGVGHRLRRAAARGDRGRRVDERRVLGSRHHRHRARGRHPAPALRRVGRPATASSRSRSRPISRTTPTATIAQAKELWARLDRPNVMIKIPATAEGVPAIAAALAAGHQRQRHADLQPRALRRSARRVPRRARAARRAGDDISRIASVASFFVSRVDTETDRRLPEGHPLRGRAAVANAKLAYQQFLATFAGARWDALAAKGARVQRPLWASTSTKNPAYSPTLYVDTLIGRDTVNTLAQASVDVLEAGDGDLRADTVLEGVDEARATMAGLAAAGVDFDDVTATLGARRCRRVRGVVPRRGRHARRRRRASSPGNVRSTRRRSTYEVRTDHRVHDLEARRSAGGARRVPAATGRH